MALLVGLDDTDSRAGGCTTSLADGVARLFPELEPEGPPRLVRLNPNVPWKTRGNGAIAVVFRGDFPPGEALARVRALVEREARREPGTSPGVVVSAQPVDAALYDAAVTRVVPRAEALHALARADARWWGGRGVIGAAAAIAWNPYRDREDQDAASGRVAAAAVAWPAERATWERIAYRDRMARDVDPARVRDVERRFPTLFDSYDLVEDDVVCVPSSPCPVLWGLRGTDPDDLARASALLGPQRPARETLFLTNHASDDHLVDRSAADARGCVSARVRGRLADDPAERNGTVFATLRDETGALRLAAYPPTRSFRRAVLALRAGDEVTACGGVHDGPDGRPTLGLEKLLVHEAAPRKVGNPACPTCGRAMKSAGKGAGYRCHGHRAAAPRTAAGPVGWFEVPASARRHLARPLKLDGHVRPTRTMLNPRPAMPPP